METDRFMTYPYGGSRRQGFALPDDGGIAFLVRENQMLREEIRVARQAAEITASLTVKQFEETERILRRFQDANAQRKAVLDSARQIAIFATDNSGIIKVFNTGAENLLGYDAREVIGKATPELFHLKSELLNRLIEIDGDADRRTAGIDVFFVYAQKGISEQQEWTYVRKDGSLFPVTLSVNALRGPEEEINGLLCIAMDITEKKRSEKALAESERKYRLLIDNIPNIVYRGYIDGSIEFFDDKIESLTGYRKEEFMDGRLKWSDLIVEEDRGKSREKFIQALKGDKSYIREYRVRKKSGDVVWIEACSQIICDEDGDVEFITGAFLDVSERKKAERALYESEEKYRSLFDGGPNPIFVIDRETLEILDANPAAEQVYGYPRQDLVGRDFESLGTFEYENETFSLIQDGLPADSCVVSRKMRHYRQNGEPFYAEVKACGATYRNRPVIILAATDVTETIEKDAQLFQASKMTTLGEMSAGIAHELNQPLNAIKIGNDYLKNILGGGKAPSPEELIRVATVVNEQVERASGIINRLREFGRKPDFKKEPVCINTTIREVMQLIGQQLALQNIRVRYELAEALPPILANKNRLEQVIFNLVTNARDAIELKGDGDGENRSGIITLTTTANGGVTFKVADTGHGIPENALDKVFEPFYTTKEVGKGMGLGLAITYGIVREFGGTIRVISKMGKGTCFALNFPQIMK